MLGDDSLKRAFYYHVERSAHLEREEIPCNLKAFHAALTCLFFEGAAILERHIARTLFDRLGLEFEEKENWNISDYAKRAACLTNDA